MSEAPLAATRFSMADQQAFAGLSGDFNPIHMDEAAARRSQAGACLAHGVHTALWALEQLAAAGEPLDRLAQLKVQFNKFAFVGAELGLTVTRREPALIRAAVRMDGVTVTSLTLRLGERAAGASPGGADGSSPAPDAPLVLDFPALAGRAGTLTPPPAARPARMFPRLSAALGEARINALAQLSTLVGMVCPGLYSIFSGFEADLVDADGPALAWRVERTDERFHMAWIEAHGGGIQARLVALVRAPPVSAQSMAELARRVAKDRFAGQRALVVGGSRGLGAVTAKLLAAGGAEVVLTYARESAEADAVCQDIATVRGAGAATALRLDVTGDIIAQLSGAGDFTHLYYFATPKIFRQNAALFSQALLDEFMAFYVGGFYRLYERLAGSLTYILYPSTTALEERPAGLTEYAMAKAAGEALCADLMAARPGLVIATPRIGRVLTDQTATTPPVPAADPAEVIENLLRDLPADPAQPR